MDRAKELANQMAEHAISHSRTAFKVHGGREAMVKQFEPYAEIIADLESLAAKNAENIARCDAFISHLDPDSVPDHVPANWRI